MKRIVIFFLLVVFILFFSFAALAKEISPSFFGEILIQTESYGRAWYIHPKDGMRYYLKDADFAFQTMSELALGIGHQDLLKIPESVEEKGDKTTTNRFRGYFLLDVERRGELWYVLPKHGYRVYIDSPKVALDMMRKYGRTVKNTVLAQIPMNERQIVADYAFTGTVYAQLRNTQSAGKYADVILPLASLTKLITALVLLDTSPDWQKRITMTEEQLRYPKKYVGDDQSSEIALRTGESMSFRDLWVAMLVSSSNQATIALVDSTGVGREEFVRRMNEKAASFGLKKTLFYECAGLDAHNVSTAAEFAVIAQKAFAQPKIAETSVFANYEIWSQSKSGQKRRIPVINRNFSLLNFHPDGAKTGFLVEAQRNVALQKGAKTIVVLHAESMGRRNSIIQRLLKGQ